jgi:hypothetical protein
VRVIDRVHRNAANGRADTAPAVRTGLADLAQAVLFVADFTDGGAALDVHAADFARAQTNLSVDAFAGQQLADVPAERAICAPLPGSISTQWMVVPTGMLRIGSVLPALIGASEPTSAVGRPPCPSGR